MLIQSARPIHKTCAVSGERWLDPSRARTRPEEGEELEVWREKTRSDVVVYRRWFLWTREIQMVQVTRLLVKRTRVRFPPDTHTLGQNIVMVSRCNRRKIYQIAKLRTGLTGMWRLLYCSLCGGDGDGLERGWRHLDDVDRPVGYFFYSGKFSDTCWPVLEEQQASTMWHTFFSESYSMERKSEGRFGVSPPMLTWTLTRTFCVVVTQSCRWHFDIMVVWHFNKLPSCK